MWPIKEKVLVDLELDLAVDTLLWLAIRAHERDMKLNDLITEILKGIVNDS